MSPHPLHDLEPSICDLAIATQVLATLIEGTHPESLDDRPHVVLESYEHEMLLFMIYEIRGRSNRLKEMFYKAEAAS